MVIALLMIIAAADGAEPIYLTHADNAHHWRPKASDTAILESKLRVPDRMGGPLTNFDRYYTGVYRQGHRVLFVELLRLSTAPGAHRAMIVRPDKVPGIGDGGCGVIRLSYDMETKEASSLDCNFDGPGPPPPPPGAGHPPS